MRVIDSGASYIINDHVYIESTIILVWTLYHVILSDWANHIANILSGAKQALGIISRNFRHTSVAVSIQGQYLSTIVFL